MSRWSLERVRIGLAPDRVEAVRLARWPSRVVVRQVGLAVAPQAGQPPWRAALDALVQALPDLASRGERAAVVLSNHLVRYLVLPWQDAVTRASELDQLARLRFEQVYGAVADDWTLRVSGGAYGAPHLAAAIDTALLAGLHDRLAAQGLRAGSVQPLLMAACNDHRRQLTGGGSALAVIEPGRVCLGLTDRGRWLGVRSRRAGVDAADAIEQERVTVGAEAEAMPLHVLLVGEGARWVDATDPPARRLGAAGAPRMLALCGTA